MINSRGLRFAYAGSSTPIVFPDVKVSQGHVLVLRGASGSGKSTWLSLVAALVAPHSGTLCVAQQDLSTLAQPQADAWRARTIGFLPQKLHLSAALTVEHNLALAFWAAGVAPNPTRIRSVLAELGVADLASRLPGQLSGGQAQRVALARAVLQQPHVVLADEPTASLDDGAAADAVCLLLSASHTHGATLVIATHDARVAQVLAQQGYDATRCTFLHLDSNAQANTTRTTGLQAGGGV